MSHSRQPAGTMTLLGALVLEITWRPGTMTGKHNAPGSASIWLCAPAGIAQCLPGNQAFHTRFGTN
ncbi:hypothetical protein [Aeromicrobium sp. UC242_57]|uniref:hypothetical protein n=1 Tax=Aeromicrobium sp. UC242_57 TaxID=3374624 RepID=UPI0037944A24